MRISSGRQLSLFVKFLDTRKFLGVSLEDGLGVFFDAWNVLKVALFAIPDLEAVKDPDAFEVPLQAGEIKPAKKVFVAHFRNAVFALLKGLLEGRDFFGNPSSSFST